MINGGIDYTIEQSREGLPTLCVTDSHGKIIYLHSRFHPSRDEDSLKNQYNPERYDTLIVLGAGLGYHLAPLRELHRRYAEIIIVDILAGIESDIGRNPAAGFLRNCGNIRFLTGKSPGELCGILAESLDIGSMKGLQVLEHTPSLRAFPEYYLSVKKCIDDILNRQAGNTATRQAFSMRYLRNSLINLPAVMEAFPVASFFNTLKDYPKIVITSGPSLEAQMEYLRRFQDRIFIIAVDSALPVLTRYSIVPDFLVSIDPQPFIYEHFIHGDAAGIIPVYALSSHPLPVERRPGLLSLNSHPLAQLLEELYPGRIGSVDSATGTVAGDALCLADKLGSGPIALAGFDFCFPRFSIYARGSAYQLRFSRYFQNRFSPVETFNFRYIMKSSRGFRHQGRYSRKSFLQYKTALETFLNSRTVNTVQNLSPDGIPLEGVPFMKGAEFFRTYCKNVLPKSGIKSGIPANSEKLSRIISLNEIQSLFQNDELRRRLIEASLGPNTPEAVYHKAERRIQSFLKPYFY